MNRRFPTLLLLLASLCCAGLAQAQNAATDTVAAAVRQNGYECSNPQSAEPDPERSAPDEKAWVLHCENVSYRVKFIGDRGAQVEPVND